jgi:hypothetical protein
MEPTPSPTEIRPEAPWGSEAPERLGDNPFFFELRVRQHYTRTPIHWF